MSSPARWGVCAAGGVCAVLTGCASYPLHANLTDAEFNGRASEAFYEGMTREEVETRLDSLRLTKKWRIVREDPPGILQRVWEPGGFWVEGDFDIVEWVDMEFHFDREWTLERWATTRHSMRYDNGRPYTWDSADGPPRNFPLPPLPPREWRGTGSK